MCFTNAKLTYINVFINSQLRFTNVLISLINSKFTYIHVLVCLMNSKFTYNYVTEPIIQYFTEQIYLMSISYYDQ